MLSKINGKKALLKGDDGVEFSEDAKDLFFEKTEQEMWNVGQNGYQIAWVDGLGYESSSVW